MLTLNRKGNINLDALGLVSEPFIKPPRTSKDGMKYDVFMESMGGNKESKYVDTKTPIGDISVNVHSQFWKMLRSKERRADILMNINKTLTEPLLVADCGGSIFFFKSFQKPSGRLFCMVSVCTLGNDGETLVLKTNYQLRSLKKVSDILSKSVGNILYDPYAEARKDARKRRRAKRRGNSRR